MTKPSYLGANVEVDTDTFASFVNKVNLVLDDMGKTVVTVAPVTTANATNGSMSVGNAHIEGILSTKVSAIDELRGGTIDASAAINLSSNVVPKANTSPSIGISTNRIPNVFAVNTNILTLTANVATITTGDVVTLTSNVATITTGNVATLNANAATIANAQITSGNVATLNADVATVANAQITSANIATLKSANADLTELASNNATVQTFLHVVGDLQVDGTVALASNAAFSVNTSIIEHLTVLKTADIDGNTVIGSANTDSLVINAKVYSDIIPNGNTYYLGSADNRFKGYISNLEGDVTLNGSLIPNGNTHVLGNATNRFTAHISTLEGDVTITGNTAIGNANTDSIVFNAKLNSNIVPTSNNFVIGATAARIKAYISSIENAMSVNGAIDVLAGGISRGALVPDGSNNRLILRKYSNTGATDAELRMDGPGVNDLKYLGNTVWHAGNDGAGSGLDADLLDGLSSGSFIRSDTGQTLTAGIVTTFRPTSGQNMNTSTGGLAPLEIRNDTTGADAFMSFHASGDYALYFGLDAATNDIAVGGWSMGAVKNKVWHAGNDGAGSGLHADLLDGQEGSYYTAITARLGYTPLNKAGDTMTGALTLQGTGTNQFQNGNGDAASYSSYNFALQGWNGMAMKDHTATVRGFYDFRNGKWDTLGGFFKNGVEAVYNNGGTYSIHVTGNSGTSTLATKSSTLSQNGGNGSAMTFNWSGQGGQPSWLWGGNDGANMYVYNPSNFSVNYATTAGNANNLGGVAPGSWMQKTELGGQFASIGYAELGSIALMKRTTSGTFSVGDTSLGSQLVWSNADGSLLSGASAGTWQCLGRATGAGSGGSGVALWKRITA